MLKGGTNTLSVSKTPKCTSNRNRCAPEKVETDGEIFSCLGIGFLHDLPADARQLKHSIALA